MIFVIEVLGTNQVYTHYRKWSQDGTWERILEALNRLSRKKQNRSPDPRYGIVDSQSVKTQYSRLQLSKHNLKSSWFES